MSLSPASPPDRGENNIKLDTIPAMRKDHLIKQGHFRKNWKHRFFVLELGRLSYFEKENSTGEPPYGLHFLKSVVLRNTALRHHPDPTFISLANKHGKNDLLIQANSAEVADSWRKSFQEHMLYALAYPNAALQQDHEEDSFRRSIAEALVASEVLSRREDGVAEAREGGDSALPQCSPPYLDPDAPRHSMVREISESVLDMNFSFENQAVALADAEEREREQEDSSFEDSTAGEKDMSSAQAVKVVDADLVAVGKQLRQLELESKRAQEQALKDWQKDAAPRLKEAIKELERRAEALRKEQRAALKNKTGQHSEVDEAISALVVEQDALKLQLYFSDQPPGSVSFGSGGVYFSMDYIWLESLAGKFRLKLSSSAFGAQLLFTLLGAGEGEGVVVDVTVGGFKLKSEIKGIPSLTLDSLNVRVSLRVELLLCFLASKQQWTAAPEQFVVQLLSFKGPFGISRSMVSALLSIAVPVLKRRVLEMLPAELGVFLSGALVPLDVEGSFQLDGSVVVSELFHGMQKSPKICHIVGYNPEQMLNFLALQKSLDRKVVIKSVIDLLRYRNDHRQQAQWEGLVRLWDQAAIIYYQARRRNPELMREAEVRMMELNFENEDDEEIEFASSAFLSFHKLLLGAREVEKNPLTVRFSLDTFRMDTSVGLMLRRAEEYYARVAREQRAQEAGGKSITKASKLYVEKMKQLCGDSQQHVAGLKRLIHNLQFVLRMHVTSGPEGTVSMVAKEVYTQFPISFNVHVSPDSDSVFSPIVPTMKNVRTKEDGFVSVKLFHLGSEEMLKKAQFLAFKNKPRLDSLLSGTSNVAPFRSSVRMDSRAEGRVVESAGGGFSAVSAENATAVQKKVREDFVLRCAQQNTAAQALLAVRPEKMSAVKIATLNVIRPRMSFIVNDLVTLQPGAALFIVQVGAEAGGKNEQQQLQKEQQQEQQQHQKEVAESTHSKEVAKKYTRRRSSLLGEAAVAEAISSFQPGRLDMELLELDLEQEQELEVGAATQELEELGTPISLQGAHGLRTEAHVPELQFQGKIPRLLQFAAHHLDDVQLLADFFDESAQTAEKRVEGGRKLLGLAGKYLLTPSFEVLLNLGMCISARADDVTVTCTTNKKHKHVLNLFIKLDFADLLADWAALMNAMVES